MGFLVRCTVGLSRRRTCWGRGLRFVEARASPIRPVRASSMRPCGRRSSSKDSSCSGVPTTSKTMESGPRSATRASKTSARAISSARVEGSADTRTSASSRSTASPAWSVDTRRTFTSLCICFSICSSRCAGQSTVSTMRETSWRSVGPTARLSMLKPRRANMFETRASAPGRFSTSTETVCVTPRPSPLPRTRSRRWRRRPPGSSGSTSPRGRSARRRRRCGRRRSPPRGRRRGRPRTRP